MNLLIETLAELANIDQAVKDIYFIGTDKATCTWDEFKRRADREYDESGGIADVNEKLKIVFVDGTWLERNEYDGSEWWEYKKSPILPPESRQKLKLFSHDS